MEVSAEWVQAAAAILGIIVSGAGTVMWFLFRSIKAEAEAAKQSSENLKTDLANYKLYVAEHYVTQNELTKAISSLEKSIDKLIVTVEKNSQETRESFGQLYERLDKKADKSP